MSRTQPHVLLAEGSLLVKGDPEETPGCPGQGKQRPEASRGGKETLITTHQREQQECLSQGGPTSWEHPGAGPQSWLWQFSIQAPHIQVEYLRTPSL